MEFTRQLRKPSAFHEQNLSIEDKDERTFDWNCVDCGGKVSVDLNKRLNFTFGGFAEGQFSTAEIDEVRSFYAMGEHSRSPCGGPLSFEIITCPDCRAEYLFSYGVKEPSNSFLILTVQGIAKIERAQQNGDRKPNPVAS